MIVKEIDKHLRPREKAKQKGLFSLSDSELLALILGNGIHGKNVIEVSETLLERSGGFKGLFRRDENNLVCFDGISDVKALTILALGEIHRRASRELLPTIKLPSAETLFKIFQPSLEALSKETLIILCYDKKGAFLSERRLYAGTASSLLISHTEIFRELLTKSAYSYYLIHNHPSGEPLPSSGEISDTLILKNEGEELSLRLNDHIIISESGYFSFRENCLLSNDQKSGFANSFSQS